jgi:hypothetical protein
MTKLFEPSVPDTLARLLAIDKKSDLERYCSKLTIRSDQLTRLILYSPLIGYLHGRAHEDFEPKEAELSTEDIKILRERKVEKLPKLGKKIKNLFAVRKRLSAHLFYNGVKWHLFYFTFRDMERPGHWTHGSHIHFVNYLWPEYQPDQLEQLLFSERRTKINGIHIKYDDGHRASSKTASTVDGADREPAVLSSPA